MKTHPERIVLPVLFAALLGAGWFLLHKSGSPALEPLADGSPPPVLAESQSRGATDTPEPGQGAPVAPAAKEPAKAAASLTEPKRVALREAPAAAPEEAAFRRGLAPRQPFPKMEIHRPEGEKLRVVVKFLDALQARALEDGRVSLVADAVPAPLDQAVDELDVRFESLLGVHEPMIAKLATRAEKHSNNAQADLAGTLVAVGRDATPEGAVALAERLNALEVVEYAYLEATDRRPEPPLDVAPTTPSFIGNQNYRNAAFGTFVDLAWGEYGARGHDVRFGDTEWAANINHEDLTDVSGNPRVTDLSNNAMCANSTNQNATPLEDTRGGSHGTAVLGLVGAGDNGYGMVGVAPDASLFFASEWMPGGRNASLGVLADNSRAGDVILLEQQANGPFPGNEFGPSGNGPADLDPTLWNLVKMTTDCGVVVVITAGNGDADLDRAVFAPYRNRGDNGAIINGAGTSDNTHFKLDFSSHGTPVHLQGWGQNVSTLGYGNLANVDNFSDQNLNDCVTGNQWYTNTFGGTSSAGPIVASACVAVQSVAKAELGRTLTPREMRQLLIDTGTPQTLGGGTNSGIGTYEAESLTVTSASGTAISTVPGGGASGNFLRLESTANGQSFTFTIPNVNRGTYVVKIRQVIASDLGIFQLAAADTGGGFNNRGATADQYRSTCCAATTVEVATVSFNNNGAKQFRLTVAGANPSATARRLTVDQIILEDAAARGKVGPLVNISAALKKLMGTPVPVALDAAGSYTQAFVSGTPVPEAGWTLIDGAGGGRTEIVDGALRMDHPGGTSTCAATLHANLSGRSGVVLSYDLRESSDETDTLTAGGHFGIRPGDGVCISADGVTWHAAQQWNQPNSDWTRMNLNLDAAIAAAGISYTADFRVRFQTTDNTAWSADGFEIDNVVLRTSAGSQLALSTRNLGLSVLQGQSPAPVTFHVLNRGATSAPFNLTEAIPWATVSPLSGTVPAGGSVAVTATYDTSAVAPGVYGGSIDFAPGNLWINLVVHATSAGNTYRQFDTLPLTGIPSSGPADRYPIPLIVSGLAGRIVDVDVHLWGLTHMFPDDLDILLVAPDGTEVLLMSDAGFSNDVSGIHLRLDDQAGTALPDGATLASGTYRPANYQDDGDDFFPQRPTVDSRSSELAVLRNHEPNGTWALYVHDDAGGDSGSLSGYTLYLTTETQRGGIAEDFDGGGDNVDLAMHAITFTPDASGAGFSLQRAAITALPSTHTAAAKDLALTDDSSVPVFLGDQGFPFFGRNHTSAHLGSNGYLTFGEATTLRPAAIVDFMPFPIIAGLCRDLDPAAGGTVRQERFADRNAFTFQNVPSFGSTLLNTFQLELFDDGRVRLSWLGLGATNGMVGLSSGFSDLTGFVESDLIIPRRPHTPGHVPHAIPGIVQAEDFDEDNVPPLAYSDSDTGNNGGAYRPAEDVDIEACTDVGGGHNIGWMVANEWQEYSVNVASAGRYSVYARVASAVGGGAFRLEFNGVNKSGTVAYTGTGGWQNWRTFVRTGIDLAAGPQTLRVFWEQGNCNLNHLTFVREDANNEPGLVAHWKFDAASGTAVADAAGDHDGTIQGATGWLPSGGVSSGALAFTGSNNRVSVPTDDLLKLRALNNAYTVSTWVRLDGFHNQHLLYHGLGCSSWASWRLSVGSGEGGPSNPGGFLFVTRAANAAAGTSLADPRPVELGLWSHLAVTYDGTLLRFFVNGGLVGETPLVDSFPYASPEANLILGGDPGCSATGRDHLDGALDDTRLYVRALTPAEVNSQALAGLPSGGDRDGDGRSNGDETIQGTDPFDPEDIFLPAFAPAGVDQIRVPFQGRAGRRYRLQFTTNLVPNSWTTISTLVANSDGPQEFLDTNTARTNAPRGFYRVSVDVP